MDNILALARQLGFDVTRKTEIAAVSLKPLTWWEYQEQARRRQVEREQKLKAIATGKIVCNPYKEQIKMILAGKHLMGYSETLDILLVAFDEGPEAMADIA